MPTTVDHRRPRLELKDLLSKISSIALIGASPKPQRASNEVMAFMQTEGYKVIPINPVLKGKKIHNETVIGSLTELNKKVDMVDIFRNSEAAGTICEEVLTLPKDKRPKVVWMQIGVINHAAATKLEQEGIEVIMDECPKRVLDPSYEY